MFEDIIKFLDENNIPYVADKYPNGQDVIYVHSRKETELKNKHPRKYKNLYVPYLRISEHDGHDGFYTRQDGWCCYKSYDEIIEICRELGA